MQEQDKHDPNYVPSRDEKGRLLPGHTANLRGRPKHSQDRYNKKTLKALSRFVESPERMQEMLQECWEADKIKTMGMVLGARTKGVSIEGDGLKTLVVDFSGYDEDAIDGELIDDAELVEDEPPGRPLNEQSLVVHCNE